MVDVVQMPFLMRTVSATALTDLSRVLIGYNAFDVNLSLALNQRGTAQNSYILKIY